MKSDLSFRQLFLRLFEFLALAAAIVSTYAFFLGLDIGPEQVPSAIMCPVAWFFWAVAGVLSRVPQQ